MALNRITLADLAGKGNVGLPDTPGLSTEAMQRKLDELSLDVIVPKFNELVDALAAQTGASDIGAVGGSIQAALNALAEGKATVNALDALETRVAAAETQKADKSEVLRKGSGEAYTPAGPYDPATRKYVDDTVTAVGAGDMSRAVYDTDGDGVVDDAAALGGVAASEYVTAGTLAAAEERIASAAAAAQTTADTAQATADGKVSKSGDTMTGNLSVNPSSGEASINATSSAGLITRMYAKADGGGVECFANNSTWLGYGFLMDSSGNVAYNTKSNMMPKSGGSFTGQISVPATNGDTVVMNSRIVNQAYNATLSGYAYIDFQLK